MQTFIFNTVQLVHLTSNFSTFFLAISSSELVSLVSVLIATLSEYNAAACHQKASPNTAVCKCSDKWYPKSFCSFLSIPHLWEILAGKAKIQQRPTLLFPLTTSPYLPAGAEESEGSKLTAQKKGWIPSFAWWVISNHIVWRSSSIPKSPPLENL